MGVSLLSALDGKRRTLPPDRLTAKRWEGWRGNGPVTPVMSCLSETSTAVWHSAWTATPASLLAPRLRGAPAARRSSGRSSG
jgi:hypothetical protein